MLMEGEENNNGQKIVIVNDPGPARPFFLLCLSYALNNATFSTEKNTFALDREHLKKKK